MGGENSTNFVYQVVGEAVMVVELGMAGREVEKRVTDHGENEEVRVHSLRWEERVVLWLGVVGGWKVRWTLDQGPSSH